MKVEPILERLTGEQFYTRISNTSEEAQPDVNSREFWNAGQIVFLT